MLGCTSMEDGDIDWLLEYNSGSMINGRSVVECGEGWVMSRWVRGRVLLHQEPREQNDPSKKDIDGQTECRLYTRALSSSSHSKTTPKQLQKKLSRWNENTVYLASRDSQVDWTAKPKTNCTVHWTFFNIDITRSTKNLCFCVVEICAWFCYYF